MRIFDLIAVLLVVAAAFSYLNFRFLKLPTTIGLMSLTLIFSVGLLALGSFVPAFSHQARAAVERFDFDEALLHGMLGSLLFAGADLGRAAGRHLGGIGPLFARGRWLARPCPGGT